MTDTRLPLRRDARNGLSFAWSLAIKAATQLAARALNMPEPLLVDTGTFVFAQVQAAEHRAAKTLCPFTLLRRFFNQRRNTNR